MKKDLYTKDELCRIGDAEKVVTITYNFDNI